MRIRREDEGEGGSPNMTPFLDMMFILIIFFLATSRFQQEERDEQIRLVKSRSTLPIATASELPVVINIDREGHKRIDGRVRTLEEIEEFIRARRARQPDVDVVLRADKRALVEHLAEALEICHRLGVKTPNVSYQASD
jgi:biopolymer transport protein ExbD